MDSHDLYAFLRDPNLVELIEQNKVTDDLLDVFTLTENQHSDVLAWCMNPNEGHAQGDAVIKDFLEAGYAFSADATWDNKKFFAKWTPGRIRTSSFGSAFVTREFRIEIDKEGRNGRLDLFLVDPQNKLLITIENKVGASLTAAQLEKYVQAVKNNFGSSSAFSDYDFAFIVLDRDLASYSDEHLVSLSRRWTLLDYGWLEASAKRARLQLARNRGSAQLLVAYCQRQTEWESPTEKRISELAADLALTHPCVLEALHALRGKALVDWKARNLKGHYGELTLFQAQHQQVVEKLLGIRGIATIVRQLSRAVPNLAPDKIETGRTWINIAPANVLQIMRDTEDAGWPVYINLYRDSRASRPDSPKFTLRLVWVRSEFNPSVCDEPILRARFEHEFKGLRNFANSDIRRLVIGKHLSPSEVLEVAKKLYGTVSEGIASYSKR